MKQPQMQLVMLYCGLDLSLRGCAGEIARLQGYLSDMGVKSWRICLSGKFCQAIRYHSPKLKLDSTAIAMHITRSSLLNQLTEKNPKNWQRFSTFYKPMIANWLKSHSLQTEDVEDLTQEIMLYIVENINSFEHNGQIGAFRNWLRAVTLNICRNYLRKMKPNFQQTPPHLTLLLEQLEDPNSNQSYLFNLAHDRVIIQILLENLAEHFQAETISIFKLYVIEEIPATDVAAVMNVSIASVHVAKSRVLRRLRQDAKSWLDNLNLDLG